VNFTGATSVTIGGVPVRSFTIAPDGQTITVTASTTATGVVTIATPFGEASTTIPYSYGVSSLGNTSDPRVPAILNFTPTSGSRGQRVRVFGRNLVNLSQVRFGGVPVQSFTQISTTEIVCVVSTGATGRIEATTALGVARSLRNFTFTTNGTLADVVITDFVPKFGATGATMTIVGENFLNVSNVRIGGVDVQSFVVNSTTEITAVVGTGANGLVSLEASLGQASSIEPFTFIDNYVDNDSVALAKFYLIANGVAWARSDGWYSLTPLDQWHGVTVQIINGERRAVRLELPDNGIASYYPRVLRRLDELRVLNLSGNSISPAPAPQMSAGQMMGSGGSVAGSGSDGSSSGSLPRWIGNYSKLEELRLSDAQLSGAVPDSVWALSNLRVIDLQRNNLMGSVGDGICSMSELRELLLSNNRITGTLPECIANVVNLTTLDIGSNRLGGQLPSGLAQIATLKVLRAGNNSFTGSLPPFGQNAPAAKVVRGVAKTAANDTPTGLEILDVGTNRIAGEIPASLGNLRSLTTLMLNNNSFTGQIPPTLWNAQSLRSAYLHSNRLAGELDESIATAQQVQILRLDSNRLTGAVPEAVARLVRLRHLALGSNRFVSVPDLTNIGRLDTLRVEDNALTFESLEPNRATPVFTYSPQDSVGLGGTRVGVLGKPLIIDGTVGGENNRYRWYKRSWTRSGTGANAVWSFQENVMVEQTNAELRVNAFSRADTGTYFCHITNPTTPALTLYMRPVRISSFTIPPPPPGAPELIYPVRSAKNIPMFTPLEWRPVEDEYVYEWQVARDSTFANASIIAQGIVAETSANVTNLQHLSRYWWRVRAVNEGGIGLWSETIVTTTGAITSRNHRWFEVVSPDVKLAFPTVDFGRTARTVTTTTPARVINVSNVPLVLTNVVAVDAEGNFSIVSSTATLQPSQTLRLQASFTPKTIGYKQGNATLSFRETRAGVPLQMQAVSEAFRGRSAALDLQRVDFDTVLVGRNAFSTAVVINRDVQPIRILNARIMPSKLYPTPSHQGIFAVEPIEEGGVVLGSGDTTALIFRCKTPGVGRFFDRYEVQADIDTAQSDTRAASRKQRPGDVVIGGGVSADTSNVPPGSPVTLTMYIFSGNARQLYAATQPEFTAVLRFDRNLLALDAAQGSKAYLVRNSAGTRTARMVLPLRWDGRDTIIARVPCVAVQGDTDRTRIQIEQLNWGSQNLALTSVGLGANRVFVDSLRDGIFMSDLCKAGGKRLVRQTTAVGLVASRPNPTSDQATIAYSLRTSGMTEIQLLDLNGKLITTLLRGMQEAGEHELVLDAGKLPSGVYMIVLTTPTARLTERLEVVK
jgi:Leucine-rich repeat (LRR) protein